MTSPVWLAAVGDATDPATFSGTAYHCLQAGLARGVFAGGLKLDCTGRRWQSRRVLWNAAQFLGSWRFGGYQYSRSFLDRLWQGACLPQDNVSLLNFFQLYPDEIMNRPRINRWFYIDQTLDQLFNYYGIASFVPKAVREDALSREKDQYEASNGVICHTRWAAASVVETYGINPSKVHTVLCGANLDPAAVSRWEKKITNGSAGRSEIKRALKLVFVGKEWHRKGLDRLIRAMKLAQGRGAALELLVLGVKPAGLPKELTSDQAITWGGFVDKGRAASEFISLVASCDVGCLLSRAEAGGMSLREFARLGLPTIAPDTGGSPEFAVPEATHLVAPDAPDEVIADILTRLATVTGLLERQRQAAMETRHLAGWEQAISALSPILRASA
jgi:glycosyltransferase involved in cell wall biosynthesis